ncbi:DNA/RNA endonuclease YhcR with UshA esterase domain [Crossiella equi]|uniref:DNA/RNA endonuclease YhcR with UshA esterase domain n=1 Tax=Crossiella equi TaxID=130796 RepID=A0ABS5APV0_9PSEU|nr:hypothetical protein [Crossiella equi]MBP2478461.1 DNA/RNA endonuclease YhcR with UshA esterase domain [Crossiella equi]
MTEDTSGRRSGRMDALRPFREEFPVPGKLFRLLVAVLALSATPAPVAAASDVLSIQAARARPLGTEVTVSGVATTPSGAFESSFYDKGFAIQDRTAGIYLKLDTDLGVEPGRRTTVTGVLTDSSGLLTLTKATVKLGGHGVVPRPEHRRTGRVDESSEGRLVHVVAKVSKPVKQDPPYGAKLFVDDGSGELTVFVNTQTGISLDGYRPGQWVRVTGFSSQYDDHYEIDPRSPRDLSALGQPWAAARSSPKTSASRSSW